MTTAAQPTRWSSLVAAPERRRTLRLLGGLHVSQYLSIAFSTTALVAILREGGVSLEQLGVLQALGLLWAVKFLWAPLLDRYGSPRFGHYRGWLLVLQPAIVVGLLGLVGLDPVGDLSALLLVTGLVMALSATQDVAADAIAVRVLDPADRGLGNGIQIAGGYLGNILGGGAVLVVYDRLGWAAAVLALALFTALPLAQVLRYREPARPAADGEARPGVRALVTVFHGPGVKPWALGLLPLLWIGVSAPYALIPPMLVDAGWSLSLIGLVLTVLAGGLAMVAALGGGELVRRWGRRRALRCFVAAQLVAVLALLPLTGGRAGWVATAAVCGLNVAYAAVATVVGTVNMDFSRRATAGSDFTTLTCVGFLAAMVAGALALAAAGQFGYRAVVLGSVVVAAVALAAAWSAPMSRERPAVGDGPEPVPAAAP